MIIKLGEEIEEYTLRNKKDEDIPVYSVTNDKGFCTGYFSKDVSSKDQSTYKIVPYGCFAYNPSRINVGSVDWQHCEDKVIVSPLYVVFKVSNKINLQYLYYYLKSDIARTYIKATAAGSVRDNLKFSMLKEFPFNLRTLEEQSKIVKVLERVENNIELCKKRAEYLDTLVKSRFIELFGDIDRKINIGSLCDVTGGYSFKSKDIISEGNVKLLQIGNVYLDNISWKNVNYLPKGYDKKYPKFLLSEGDILIALTRPIIQSLGNVKACIVKQSDLPCMLNQRVGRIVAKSDEIVDLKYIYGCLMTDKFTKYVEECSIGCSQPNISTKDIENYRIPDVSYDKQVEYVRFKTQTDKSKLAVQKSLDELETLKKSLMQEYFG